MTQFLTFKMHPGLLKNIIAQQAGSLEKAFLELIMNSIDAGATRIDISMDNGVFSIKDNGKGLGSKEDIEANFQHFGTPHEEGDAEFGRFRMGRGQIMPFAKTTWRSGHYVITTDLNNMDGDNLGFELQEASEFHNGCQVSGEVYEKISTNDMKSGISSFNKMIHTLPKMIKYSKVDVYINENLVTTDPKTAEWDKETDDAYFKFDNAAQNLSIYNKGIFVKDTHSYSYGGMGGVVVSKKNLNVNFARNDIIVYSCNVMRAIQDVLRAELQCRQKNQNMMSFNERKYYAEELTCAEIPWDIIVKKKIFKTVNNKYFSLLNIVGSSQHKRFALIGETTKNEAEYVLRNRLGIVFDDDILRLFDINNLNELVEILKNSLENYSDDEDATSGDYRTVLHDLHEWVNNELSILTLSEFSNVVIGAEKILSHKDLNKKENIVLNVLKAKNKNIAMIASKFLNVNVEPRKILIGESVMAAAWTDGASFVAINKKELEYADYGINGFSKLYAILLHEYLHTSSSSASHPHNDEFYIAFHEAILRMPQHQGIFEQARSSAKLYAERLKEKNIPISKKLAEDTRYVSEMWDDLAITNRIHYFQHLTEDVDVEQFKTTKDFELAGVLKEHFDADSWAESLLRIRSFMDMKIQRYLGEVRQLGNFLPWNEYPIFLDYLIIHRKFHAFLKTKPEKFEAFIKTFRQKNKLTEPAFLIYFSKLTTAKGNKENFPQRKQQ